MICARQTARDEQHNQEQRCRCETDNDCRQYECLRQRIGELRGIAGRPRRKDRRRIDPEPPHGENEEINRIGEERQPDDDLERARSQDQPNARAREHADAEGDEHFHHYTFAVGGRQAR